MSTLPRRRILVTGIRSGIGQAIAQAAIADGFEVWGSGRDLGQLPLSGGGFHPLALDLADPASIEAAAAQVSQAAGSLHAVVHNAGSGLFGPVDELETTQIREQFEVLCHGPWALTRRLLPILQPGSGRLLFITSLAARLPIPGMGPYNAAKAALATLVETARLEPAGPQLAWVEIQPGDIRTAFNDNLAATASKDPLRRTAFHQLWERLETHLHEAPGPEVVARTVIRLLHHPHPPPRVTTGDWFQTRLSPLAWRLLPKAWMEHLVRRYYGLS